mmetsp:Transcript_64209/g.89245  ORF Transcript_64209/g.89245 Transcript_64209/m.89245 type:complete len:130 (+) Transcript_64209:180-569(+)
MSSVSMILNTYGKKVSGSSANPATLNSWLTKNGGYVQRDLFVWASVNKLGLNFAGFVSKSNIKSAFDSGKNLILNVRNGGHWVLMNGYSGNTLMVNDPGFSKTSYDISEVSNVGSYSKVSMTYLEEVLG